LEVSGNANGTDKRGSEMEWSEGTMRAWVQWINNGTRVAAVHWTMGVACQNVVLGQKMKHFVECAKHFQIFSIGLGVLKQWWNKVAAMCWTVGAECPNVALEQKIEHVSISLGALKQWWSKGCSGTLNNGRSMSKSGAWAEDESDCWMREAFPNCQCL
jgi:hypothetical protein